MNCASSDRRSQAGFSLTDTLLAIGVMAAIFIPMTAFMVLTIQRGGDQSQPTDTTSFVQVSRFVARDLAVARSVVAPVTPGQPVVHDCVPQPGVRAWLRTQSTAGVVSFYVTRDDGDVTVLERRTCEFDVAGNLQPTGTDQIAEGIRDLEVLSDPDDSSSPMIQAPMLVSCTPREVDDPDPCTNKVVATLAGARSAPVTLEISPRVDPEDQSLVRPRAIITCNPSECGGFRQEGGTFTVTLDGSLSSAPNGIGRYVWSFQNPLDTANPPLAGITPGEAGPDGETVGPGGLAGTGPITFTCVPQLTPDAWQVDTQGGFCRYSATLVIFEDVTERSSTAVVDILIRNAAPVIRISPDPVETYRTTPVAFDSSETFDPDGGDLTFQWAFGDGSGATSTDPNPEHGYRCTENLVQLPDQPEPACEHTTTVTVSDGPEAEGGVSVTHEIPVTVRNARPEAAICDDIQGSALDYPGQTVEFTACTQDEDWQALYPDGGVRDPDGNAERNGPALTPVASYRWMLTKLVIGPEGGEPAALDPTFGDGGVIEGTGLSFDTPPLPFGVYVISLEVTDNDGAVVVVERGIKVNTAPIARARISNGDLSGDGASSVFSPRGQTGTNAGALNPIDATITLDGSESFDPDGIDRPNSPADPNAAVVEYRWRVWREGWTAPATWGTCPANLGGTANSVACEIPAVPDVTNPLQQPQLEAWPVGTYRIALAAVDNNGVESECGSASPWSGCTQSTDPADLQWWVSLKINERPSVNRFLRWTSAADINPECRAPSNTAQGDNSTAIVCRAASYTFRTNLWPTETPTDTDSAGGLSYAWYLPWGDAEPVYTGTPELSFQMPVRPLPSSGNVDLHITDSDGGTTVIRRSLNLRNHPPATAILVSQADTTNHSIGTRTTDDPANDPYVGQITSTFGDPDGHVLRREWTIERLTAAGNPLVPVERIQFVATRTSAAAPWTCTVPGPTAAMALVESTGSIGCDRLDITLRAHGRYSVRVDERDNENATAFAVRELLVLRPANPVVRVSTGGNCNNQQAPPIGTELPRDGNLVTFTPNNTSNITPCFDARASDGGNGGDVRGYSWTFPDGLSRANPVVGVNFRRCTGWVAGDPLLGCLQYPVTLRVTNEANHPTEMTIMVRFNAQPVARFAPAEGQNMKIRFEGSNQFVRLPSCVDGCVLDLNASGLNPTNDGPVGPNDLSYDPDGLLPDRSGPAPIAEGEFLWARQTGALAAGTLLSPPDGSRLTVQINPISGGNLGLGNLRVRDDDGYLSGPVGLAGTFNRPPQVTSFRSTPGNPYIPTGTLAPVRALVPEAGDPAVDPNCSTMVEGTDPGSLWERIPGMLPGEQAASADHFFWTFVQNGVTTTEEGVSGVECIFGALGGSAGATVVSSPPVQFDQANGPVTVTLRVIDSDDDEGERTESIQVRPPNPDGRIDPVTTPPANTPDRQLCRLGGSSSVSGATSGDCSVWQEPHSAAQPFVLDGSASRRADGTSVGSYQWRLYDSAATTGNLITPTTCVANQPTFACQLPAGPGRYRVELTVWDGTPGANCLPALTNCSIVRYYLKRNQAPVINVTAPATLTRGVTTTFGCGVADLDSPIVSRSWQLLRGSDVILENPSAASCQFTLPTSTPPGLVTFRKQATDLEGATTVVEAQMTINNTAPVATFTVTGAGATCTLAQPQCLRNLPSNVTLNSSASNDPDGTIATRCWQQRAPGETEWSACTGGVTRAVTLNIPGEWQFRLTVTDNDVTSTTSAIRTVTVNPGPTVVVTANGQLVESEWVTNGSPPVSVSLSAAGSSDPDGIASYSWQVTGPGLNTTSSLATFTRQLPIAAVYTVTLTVTDTLGAATQVTRTLRVNAAPTAEIVVTRAGQPCDARFQPGCVVNPPEPVVAVGTGTDSDGTVVGFEWAADVPVADVPGEFERISLGSDPTLDLATLLDTRGEGQYRLELTVTDDNGGSTTAVAWVLYNPLPIVTLPPGPIEVQRGQNVSVTATATDPPPSTGSLSFTWSVVQDGTTLVQPITTASPSYSPFIPTSAGLGDAEVQVVVTDTDGGSVTATVDLLIVNAPPSAAISPNPSSTLITGETGTWTFSSSSSDIDGTIAWIGWTVTGGDEPFETPTDTPTPVFPYTFEGYGTYTVTLLVTDNDGATTEETIQVRLNQAPTAVITNAPLGTVLAGDAVQLDGTDSFDDTGIADGGYLWDVVAGNSAAVTIDTDPPHSDAQPSLTFAQPGIYTIRLRVFDDDGAISEPATVDIEVVAQG